VEGRFRSLLEETGETE